MIKIGYFGDGPWASKALESIVEQGDRFEVAFITPRFDTQDPALKDWAEKLGVPFLPHENVNDESFLETVKPFGCDLLVSMSFNQIMKKPFLEVTPKGVVNCHAGALPFYRGRNPLNWVLINGETEFGVTVHMVDKGIDTGDIVVQHMVPISRVDDYGSLLEKAFEQCAATLVEALEAIESGTAVLKKQSDIHPVGFYCGRRRQGDEWIDWSWSSEQIFNFIRGIALPGPGARCISEKGIVAFLEARDISEAPEYIATAGEVVGRSEGGVIVKTVDTSLFITKAADIDEQGDMGESYIPHWRIGTRFNFLLENVSKSSVAQSHAKVLAS